MQERSVCSWKISEKLVHAMSEYSGMKNCRLYSSGTLALRAAVLSLDLPPNSGVAIPSFTCREVMAGVVSAGMKPRVIDCDENGLINADDVHSSFNAGKIGAAVAVHQFGLINAEMERLTNILPVVEDCCHVPPKRFLKGSVAVIGSFEGTKLLGAGEGGYLLMETAGSQEKYDPFDPGKLGDRLSDMIAAIALNQLARLDKNLEAREKIANAYMEATDKKRVVNSDGRAAWFRFLIRMESEKAVEAFIESAEKSGVTLRRPIMPYPLHRFLKETEANCPNADKLWRTLVSVPIYPGLTHEEMEITCRTIKTCG